MIRNRRAFVAFALCVIVSASTALAGGGGSKRDSKIVIKNETSGQIGVAVDPTPALLQAVANGNVEAFLSAGGKILNPNATAEFKVKEGKHVVVGGDESFTPFANSGSTVDVPRGKTVNLRVNSSGFVGL